MCNLIEPSDCVLAVTCSLKTPLIEEKYGSNIILF